MSLITSFYCLGRSQVCLSSAAGTRKLAFCSCGCGSVFHNKGWGYIESAEGPKWEAFWRTREPNPLSDSQQERRRRRRRRRRQQRRRRRPLSIGVVTMAKSGAATTGAGQQRFESSIQQSLSPLIAGLAGGSVSTITLYPLDLVKVRQQVHDEVGSKGARKRLTFFQAVRGVVRHEGLIGLYQGLTPAVVGSAVSWGGYFFVYEGLKHRYAAHKFPHDPDPRNLSGSDNFLLATCSGVVMVAMTNPVWLIKTRMQLQMNRLKYLKR